MSWRDWRRGVEGSRRVGSEGRREMMPKGMKRSWVRFQLKGS